MSGLSDTQMADLRSRLEKRLNELHRDVEEYRDGASGKYEAAAVAAERDQLDVAFATTAATVDRVQLARDVEELRDIEASQARIRSGSYGECIDCGADVDWRRLQAWPTATRCHECQRDHERRHGRV